MISTRDQILADVLQPAGKRRRGLGVRRPVRAETRLFADLAFESLDLVVLGAKVQEHFGQTFPFPEFFAEIGQREVRDLTIGEWVDFIDRHLRTPARRAARPPCRRAHEARRAPHRPRRGDVRHPRSADGDGRDAGAAELIGVGRARDAALDGAGADAAGLDVARSPAAARARTASSTSSARTRRTSQLFRFADLARRAPRRRSGRWRPTAGLRSTVLNFPLTFPPPKINGHIVPGGFMPWRQLRLGCHPAGPLRPAEHAAVVQCRASWRWT